MAGVQPGCVAACDAPPGRSTDSARLLHSGKHGNINTVCPNPAATEFDHLKQR